jgi:serine/threonine-protein kinase RsbW
MRTIAASITGHGEEVTRVPKLLDDLARQEAVSGEAVAEMQIALDEVLTNILRYGFADGLPHRIDVRLSADADRLSAEIEDDCAPFDPLSVPPPAHIGAALEDRPIGGLGWHLVRHLMSEVRYARVGPRNRLVLVKTVTKGGGRHGAA